MRFLQKEIAAIEFADSQPEPEDDEDEEVADSWDD